MSTDRGCAWSVTINNPTDADEECINLARQKNWKVEGQKERGAEGTVHYQLMVKTPQVRFSQVKKQFPRAHIELARNVAALSTYVAKQETRIGQLLSTSDKYPSISKFWELIAQKLILEFEGPIDDMPTCKLFTNCKDTYKMAELDRYTGELIMEGYFVESHAANPAVRFQWKTYTYPLMYRSQISMQQSQTARQTDTALEMTENDLQIESNNVQIPEVSCSTGPTPSV